MFLNVHFTSQQQQIIQHSGAHARIIAVAGSGKTQTLTQYLDQRLSTGISARRVLVLMYNKAAQQDFERRLRSVRPDQPLPDIRTFHSLGYRICQTLMKQGDMPRHSAKLLSESEVEIALWRILREIAPPELAEDVLARKKKWVEPAMAYIELVKSSLHSPELVFEQTGLPAICHFFITAFARFEDWRAELGRLTFNDLIYEPVQRFQREAHLREQFANHLAEIVVDEFQDINPAQHYLLDILAGHSAQVMVVGDPDQTIYEFRGSEPTLLTEHFAKQYRGVCDYQLSHTFRFGDQLSLLANQVIAANYPETAARTYCISHSSAAETTVQLLPHDDSAAGALTLIQRLAGERPLSDIAVINRLWANSARLELLLLAQQIPHRLDHHQSVLERYELKPFRVLLQLASGAAEQWSQRTRRAAWQALLTQPYLKVKKTVVDQLIKQLSDQPAHWGRALRNAVPESLSRYQSEQLFERARWISKAESAKGSAAVVLHGWTTATDYLAGIKDSAFSSAQVEEQQETVRAFLQFVHQRRWPLAAAASELAALVAEKTPAEQDAVLITSIHKSKGRQWPVVIIPELNGYFYPHQPDGEMTLASSVASERRLLYVAITRAQQQLYLLVPDAASETPPSPLLPAAYVTGLAAFCAWRDGQPAVTLPVAMHRASVNWYAAARGLSQPPWQSHEQATPPAIELDQRISHPMFGPGTIVGASAKRLSIRFDNDRQTRVFARQAVTELLKGETS